MRTQHTPSVDKMEVLLGPDPLTEALRGKIREMILTLVDTELTEVLAALPYERTGKRCGYRHGSKVRSLTTGLGAVEIEMPWARLVREGQEQEWQSQLVRRYERRCASVDSALLGAYLSGTNQRRIKGALSPLLRGAGLSKSAISRLVGRLQSLFDDWRKQSLKPEHVVLLYLDAIALRVRIAKKVVSVPVLVALGVGSKGQKAVLDLELLSSESTDCWSGFVQRLLDRGLKRPHLVIIDGHKGLRAAVEQSWPGIWVQRCTTHKLRNLSRHVPRHALEEVRTDYHRIIEADSLKTAQAAYAQFMAKWEKIAPKVAASLAQAGEELLTFYQFPKAQWKSLRTTNAIERLNGEFRRRVKTQGSLPSAKAAELLLFGLLITGQIRMRRIDGWRDLIEVAQEHSARSETVVAKAQGSLKGDTVAFAAWRSLIVGQV